jgi:crotonobetainyl-CoA:carnitine CoA-transferase CaiB-like acyl-CoA transferase
MDLTGFPDGPPVKVGNSIADLVAGMSGAHGVTLALLARHNTRRGQKVEIAMLDVMASLLTYQAGMYLNAGRTPARRGNEHPSIVPYEVFKAADGYLALGVANNSLWERCCAALERSDLAKDPRYATEASRVENRGTLVPLLNQVLAARSGEDWMKRLEAVGVPAGRIRTVPEVCESEHLRARGMLVALPHAKAGTVKMMGVPIRLHATPGKARTAAPVLGRDTDAVLTRVLGLRRAEVQRLRKTGVV